MKLALLGDIHGNHLALRAVLAAAKLEGVERLLITGDFIGYYFWPSQVLDMLSGWDLVAVRGNHEDMLIQAYRRPELLLDIEQRYGSGLSVALDSLSAAQLDWLMKLPHPQSIAIGDCKILLCHGAPWDVDQYIYPDSDSELFERCDKLVHDWVVTGHTHYPLIRQLDKTMFVNPGSVGQPRDRVPGAAWALLDSETGQVELKREPYDIHSVANEARQIHPKLNYLSEVLLR